MIIINNKYRINSDSKQWILEENRPVQDKESENYGKENWSNIGYYPGLPQVFQRLLDMRLKELPTMELKDFLKEARKIKESIQNEFNIK